MKKEYYSIEKESYFDAQRDAKKALLNAVANPREATDITLQKHRYVIAHLLSTVNSGTSLTTRTVDRVMCALMGLVASFLSLAVIVSVEPLRGFYATLSRLVGSEACIVCGHFVVGAVVAGSVEHDGDDAHAVALRVGAERVLAGRRDSAGFAGHGVLVGLCLAYELVGLREHTLFLEVGRRTAFCMLYATLLYGVFLDQLGFSIAVPELFESRWAQVAALLIVMLAVTAIGSAILRTLITATIQSNRRRTLSNLLKQIDDELNQL